MSERTEMSRAELVRLRREQDHTRQMQRAMKEVTRPVTATAARAKKPARPARRTRDANSRRRFRIALHMPRPDLRAIHLPRLRIGWRLASFILLVILGAALSLAFTRPEFRAAPAQVTGNQMLTPDEVNAVMNIAGQPVFLLVPPELETRLLINYPELVSVRVDVSMPNLVSVHLVERKPLIRWEQAGGYTWVAEDGVAFRPRGEIAELISVVAVSAPPVIGSGNDPMAPAPFLSADMVQALKGLAGHVPPGAVILYDPAFGFGWNDPRGWRAYFGTTSSDVELKMRVYETMVNSLTQRGIRPALINVTYPTAPYYRMNQ